jgi:hypothetical protein
MEPHAPAKMPMKMRRSESNMIVKVHLQTIKPFLYDVECKNKGRQFPLRV